MTACLRVIALLPTDVPIALATSLAPMPKAIKKPANAAIIKIKVGSKNKLSTASFPALEERNRHHI